MSNKYLVQALRAYRHVSYGQFDRETHSEVQLTRDAADEIERLNAKLATAVSLLRIACKKPETMSHMRANLMDEGMAKLHAILRE